MEQRELRFRMWIGKNHRMYYGIIEVMNCMMRQMAFDQKVLPEGHDSKFPKDYVNDMDTRFMQYTGMKAKDGKDIYEGDIVVADRYPFFNDGVSGYVGVIEWAHAAWYYGLECVNDKLAGSAVGDQLGADGKEVTEFRIIGNIHEHPHLLSGGN